MRAIRVRAGQEIECTQAELLAEGIRCEAFELAKAAATVQRILVERGWTDADEVVRSTPGLDVVGTTEQLEHVATLIPDEWLAPSATGSPGQCVAAVRNQFALGCDGVIMHGASPAELQPVFEEYARTAAR